jgi:hypothetical protein
VPQTVKAGEPLPGCEGGEGAVEITRVGWR